jgi:F-type H+-transporting ATPase subunit delta
MANLTDHYATYLLKNALKENKLEEVYTHALIVTTRESKNLEDSMPEMLEHFMKFVPASDVRPVLIKFLRLARARLGLMDVNVISAIPLTEAQVKEIETKIIGVFGKQISMVTRVDPTLLGGLCIIAGSSVIDNTIKKRLADMKKNVYRGVYFKNVN